MSSESHRDFVASFRENNVKFFMDGNAYIKARGIPRHNELILDTECTGVDPWAGQTALFDHSTNKWEMVDGAVPFSVQVGFVMKDKLHCVFFDLRDKGSKTNVEKVLALPTLKIGHNLKYDIQMVRKANIHINVDQIYDTLTATRLTHDDHAKHDLKTIGNYFAGLPESSTWDRELKGWLKSKRYAMTRAGWPKDLVNYSFVPIDILGQYALNDIWYCYLVYAISKDIIEEEHSVLFQMETEMLRIVMEMEKRGVAINVDEANKASKLLGRKITEVQKRLAKSIGDSFNPKSHTQLRKYLTDTLGIPESDLLNKKHKVSTDKETIDALLIRRKNDKRLQFLKDLRDLRSCEKLKETYFSSLAEKAAANGIAHCQIKSSDTSTGRSATSDPNLQNIPRPDSIKLDGVPTVRSIFIPREGFTNFYFDYTQIEMVVFALMCQEHKMLETISKGGDLHGFTAEMMYDLEHVAKDNPKRQEAKTINFGIIYGMGIFLLANTLGVEYSQASEKMKLYKNAFPGIANLLSASKRQLYKQGYATDIFGRQYHVPMEYSYVIVNRLIQGGAANILKFAIIQARNVLRELSAYMSSAFILLPIHDELIVEVKNTKKQMLTAYLIKLAMEEILPMLSYGIRPSVEVKYSTSNWEQKQSLEFENSVIVQGKKIFGRIYNRVVLDYNIPKVRWFLDNGRS